MVTMTCWVAPVMTSSWEVKATTTFTVEKETMSSTGQTSVQKVTVMITSKEVLAMIILLELMQRLEPIRLSGAVQVMIKSEPVSRLHYKPWRSMAHSLLQQI